VNIAFVGREARLDPIRHADLSIEPEIMMLALRGNRTPSASFLIKLVKVREGQR
jgi:hypothetical protein